MNDENLISIYERSPSEAREMGRIGGKKSGEARRQKSDRIRRLDEYLDAKREGEDCTNFEQIIQTCGDALLRATSVSDLQRLLELTGDWQREQRVNLTADVEVKSLTPAAAYQKLYGDYSFTYQRFFYENRNSRHVLLQGGRRSGKTQATIRHLAALGEVMNDNAIVMVVTFQHPQLLATIGDFKLATDAKVKANKATTKGLQWVFCNFDEYTKAQGHRCDYLFINEAVNIPENIADVLMLGCTRQCFYNYNPTARCWLDKLDSGGNLLKTTFKDNDYLSDDQRKSFEDLRVRAERPNASNYDRYMYSVYYLGEYSNITGAVFTNLEQCTLSEFNNVQGCEVYGLDFGFATDGDPTVLVAVRIADRKIYVRQLIYQRGLTSNVELSHLMLEHGLHDHSEIAADYGGNGAQRIIYLRTGCGVSPRGWNVVSAIKPKILDNIGEMLMYDAVVVCEGSDQILEELQGYTFDSDKQKLTGSDHGIDALRYAFNAAKRYV